jgi:hypothetical protein
MRGVYQNFQLAKSKCFGLLSVREPSDDKTGSAGRISGGEGSRASQRANGIPDEAIEDGGGNSAGVFRWDVHDQRTGQDAASDLGARGPGNPDGAQLHVRGWLGTGSWRAVPTASTCFRIRSRPRLMFPPPIDMRASFSAGVTRAEMIMRLSSRDTLGLGMADRDCNPKVFTLSKHSAMEAVKG